MPEWSKGKHSKCFVSFIWDRGFESLSLRLLLINSSYCFQVRHIDYRDVDKWRLRLKNPSLKAFVITVQYYILPISHYGDLIINRSLSFRPCDILLKKPYR